jgi:hypothetical protein
MGWPGLVGQWTWWLGGLGVSCFNLTQAPTDIEGHDANSDASSRYTGEAWRQENLVRLRAHGVGIDSHMARSGTPIGQWDRIRRRLRLDRLSNRAPASHRNRIVCSFVVMLWVHDALHGDLLDSPAFILHYRRLVTSCLQPGRTTLPKASLAVTFQQPKDPFLPQLPPMKAL